MSISIFTPTHNPSRLQRLASSIADQTYRFYEWVIVPNGGITEQDVSDALGDFAKDPRIRIIPYSGETLNIGELKHFCCMNSKGSILAEVDHDDEITEDCLQEVAQAFEKDSSLDFVYSNCCEIGCDGKPYKYNPMFGWSYRPFEWRGKPQEECVAFDPSPASFSKIWYAPNHIRAWKASFYKEIGGHDKSLDVLDDQDLICRTYIHGNVKKIDKCLYVYYYTGENTCQGEKNSIIQDRCWRIYGLYIYQMVEKWCDLNGLRKIDLCGGFHPPKGYESIDKINGDIIHDLDNAPWPFEDGKVGLFRAHDALEHLKDKVQTIKEIYRCLSPNGWLLSFTPDCLGRGGAMDPTHVSFYNENSFWYYTRQEQAKYINTPVKFQNQRLVTFYPTEWHQKHLISYVKADLMKFDGRVPGLIEI